MEPPPSLTRSLIYTWTQVLASVSIYLSIYLCTHVLLFVVCFLHPSVYTYASNYGPKIEPSTHGLELTRGARSDDENPIEVAQPCISHLAWGFGSSQ